jgi:hypothetical protein
MDRATGRGIVLDRHVPESVRRQSNPSPVAAAARLAPTTPRSSRRTPRPELRAVVTEPSPAPAGTCSAAATAAGEARSEPASAPEKPASDESQAKKRRAAFRVIDGGG